MLGRTLSSYLFRGSAVEMGNEGHIKPGALVKPHLPQLPQRHDVLQQVTGFTVSKCLVPSQSNSFDHTADFG
jgi:hypothetical protein